jgi:hypothetical protein
MDPARSSEERSQLLLMKPRRATAVYGREDEGVAADGPQHDVLPRVVFPGRRFPARHGAPKPRNKLTRVCAQGGTVRRVRPCARAP